ncbi:MAG TPA: hypothetical protein VK419_15440 [Bryobacteraceae bacterium]|nr:hypothetical protein [Bryobacteraceae bacterium]
MPIRVYLCLMVALLPLQAQDLDFLNHNRPTVDAHNCYPYDGRFWPLLCAGLDSWVAS